MNKQGCNYKTKHVKVTKEGSQIQSVYMIEQQGRGLSLVKILNKSFFKRKITTQCVT